ncbi:hypothetical protein F8388_017463 [Cannabis sativa]|uniref:Uncharacterized protein n=1 Tax=Cannabis sativa TaxID=3483 RepID=A0A7J6F8U9_CANSA|nr:hypothetical protein F8388_017463 [Cannabis sativa]
MSSCCNKVWLFGEDEDKTSSIRKISPLVRVIHRSQRRITPAQASEIELPENSGIAPKASMELMMRRAGGHENLRFILEDCRNYIRTKRTIQMRVGDTSGVLEYLQKMKLSEDVDACLKEETFQSKDENHTANEINTTIKGIKSNNKRVRGSSSRPKSALEKMRKKTKVSKRNSSTKQVSQDFNNNDQVNSYIPLSQSDLSFSAPSFNHNHINDTPEILNVRASMTELLLQAEKASTGFI